jgi:hypothetical protein
MSWEESLSTQAFFWKFSVCFFPFGGRESGLWPEELVLFTDA